jgi:hypothetical protein
MSSGLRVALVLVLRGGNASIESLTRTFYELGPGGHMKNVGAIIESLECSPAIVIPLVCEVPQAILKRRPKPGKWSAHEHACHLAAVHPLMSSRLDLMLTDPKPFLSCFAILRCTTCFMPTELRNCSSKRIGIKYRNLATANRAGASP